MVHLNLNELYLFNEQLHEKLNNEEKCKILIGCETISFNVLKSKMFKCLNKLIDKVNKHCNEIQDTYKKP